MNYYNKHTKIYLDARWFDQHDHFKGHLWSKGEVTTVSFFSSPIVDHLVVPNCHVSAWTEVESGIEDHPHIIMFMWSTLQIDGESENEGKRINIPAGCERKERNVLFNDALNTFYLRLYGIRHMVKDHTENERKPTAASTWAWVLLYASSHRQDITYQGLVTPVVKHWLEWEKAHCIHHEGSIRWPINWVRILYLKLHGVSQRLNQIISTLMSVKLSQLK